MRNNTKCSMYAEAKQLQEGEHAGEDARHGCVFVKCYMCMMAGV